MAIASHRSGAETDDARTRFERDRLALFATHGFAGQSRMVPGRSGDETYAIVRGEGACPTVLIHGGVGAGAEWALLAGMLDGPVIMADRPGCGLSYAMDYRGVNFRTSAADWLLTDRPSTRSRVWLAPRGMLRRASDGAGELNLLCADGTKTSLAV